MTAKQSPDRASVHSIDHFALNVPSLADAERFFEAFGLDVVRSKDALDLRAGDGHRWGRVLPSTRKSLAYLTFNCFPGQLPTIERQAVAAGARFEVPRPADSDGIWFNDLDGNLIQVRVGPKTSPNEKAAVSGIAVPAGARGACANSEVKVVRPRRLSHVLLFTPNTLRAVEFYESSLGLRLSDKSADIIAFMHAPHGCDHHLVAFVKSSAKGWHHASWDVANIDEVGQGAAQMAAQGFKEGWGVGRHVLGSNYFFYVRDPWGSFCEYAAGIDFIAEGPNWQAGDFPPEDSIYQWGPPMPEYFIHNSEA